MEIGYSRPGLYEMVVEMLSKIKSEGYQGVQLKGDQYSSWLDNPDTFQKKFDIANIMGVIVYGSDEGNLKRTINFCDDLGLREITWVPSWKKGQISYTDASKILNQFGNYAKDKNTRLSLHNHAGLLFENQDDLREFCKLVNPNCSGLTIDTAHLALGGVKDIPDVIRECKDHIYLLHIKDVKNKKFYPLGTGELDFNSIFQTIRDIGFNGWLVVDDESDQMTLEEALPYAVKFIERYLK